MIEDLWRDFKAMKGKKRIVMTSGFVISAHLRIVMRHSWFVRCVNHQEERRNSPALTKDTSGNALHVHSTMRLNTKFAKHAKSRDKLIIR